MRIRNPFSALTRSLGITELSCLLSGLVVPFCFPAHAQTCLDKVPDEQAVELRTARYIYPSPPSAYHAVLGWANVVIGELEYGTQGKVIVKEMELWQVTDGIRSLVTDNISCPTCWLPEDKVFGFLVPKYLWMDRSAWDRPNQGEEFSLTAEGYVEVPAENHPDMIYHFWHRDWPRPSASSQSTYYLKANAQVTGNAMIQIGFDYYLEPGSTGVSNIEAAYSNWYCAQPGWQEIIAGVESGSLPSLPPVNMLLLRE